MTKKEGCNIFPFLFYCYNLEDFNTVRTNKKFMGTTTINTGIGANVSGIPR